MRTPVTNVRLQDVIRYLDGNDYKYHTVISIKHLGRSSIAFLCDDGSELLYGKSAVVYLEQNYNVA